MALKIFITLAVIICTIQATKRKYEIDMEKLEIVYVDPEYGSMVGDVHQYNETTKAFTGNGELKVQIDSEHDVTLQIQGYSIDGDQYKETPFKLNFGLCSMYGTIFSMFGKDIKDGNLPPDCPIPAGQYYVKNFVPDVASVLPPFIPGNFNQMMLLVNGTTAEGKTVLSLKGYGRVIHN